MSKLNEILKDQLKSATTHPGTPISRALGNGLRITMLADSSGHVMLDLARREVSPADAELVTCLKYFPPSHRQKPEEVAKFAVGQTFYLRTFLDPVPWSQLQMDFSNETVEE